MNSNTSSLNPTFAAALLVAAAPALAQTPPIALSFDSPNALGPVGVLYDRGWNLTLRADMPNALLHVAPVPLREADAPFGFNQFIVLTDPDGCLDLRTRTVSRASYAPGCTGPDEEVLDAYVDEYDSAGVVDRVPVAGRPLVEVCRGSSALLSPPFHETLLSRIHPRPVGGLPAPATPPRNEGPKTGPDPTGAQDCFGYGQDDDLPGLVIMADVGAARFYTPGFDRVPQGIRNMAGLLSSVALELSGNRGSSVVATMFVQPRFLDALVMIDSEVTLSPWVGYDFLQRVDGGPIEGRMFAGPRPSPGDLNGLTNAVMNSLPIRQILVRAAIVRGPAPNVIEDRDGDRHYTAADLELMGYTLLSNEARITIRATPAARLDDGSDTGCPTPTLMYHDLDGDRSSGLQCITGSSNSKVRVPR